MEYPRKRYTTRRAPARKTYGRRAPVRRYAKQIPRGYPTSRGTQGELKSIDINTGSLAADTTGAIGLLNGCARGDDVNERTGRQICMKSLDITFTNQVTPATGTDQTQRVMVVLDRQPNAAPLAITDVLISVSTLSLTNLDNRNRFVVLYDKLMYLNATGEAGAAIAYRKHIPMRNIITQFNNGNAGTIADITTNSVYVISIGGNVAGVTAGTTVYRSRLRYTDK